MKSSHFLGCLAPGWVIQWSYWIPWSALALAIAFGAACFAVELRRRSFRWLPLYAGLLVLQPGWFLLSREELFEGVMHVRADCGYGQRSLSLFLLGGTIALLVIVYRRPALSRRSFIFGLAVVLLLLSIAESLYVFTPVGRVFPESTWFEEVHASIVTGVTTPFPLEILVLVLICAVLYFIRRLPFRKAV